MSLVINARKAFESGFISDCEYIFLLDQFKLINDMATSKQIAWMEDIAARIESGIQIREPQDLTARPLRSVKVIDALGSTSYLTSFNLKEEMAERNLVEANSPLGRRRARSRSSLKRSA